MLHPLSISKSCSDYVCDKNISGSREGTRAPEPCFPFLLILQVYGSANSGTLRFSTQLQHGTDGTKYSSHMKVIA
jgi:hypothetical protein